MTIGQDLTSTPDSARDAFSLHSDWFGSRWSWVLPRDQSFMVAVILASAADHGVEGSLDDITRAILGDSFSGLFEDLEHGWDAPVRWLRDEDFEDPEEGETEEQLRASAVAHQALCEGMLRAAGAPVPTTLRELVDAMAALGIVSSGEGRWSMPELLPRPEDTLAMPAEMAAEFRAYRRRSALTPFRNALLRHLTDGLGYPEELFTSLDRLSTATGVDVTDLRPALDSVVEDGDIRLYRGTPRSPVAAQSLAGHTRFHLVPDWDHYSADRLQVVRGD
ncbi:DUF6042 family protein [Streptomyces sp. NPDC055749]